MIKHLSIAIPAAAMAAVMLLGPAAPVRANTTTTAILIGAAAALAATAINVSNKNRVASTVVGYLPNGDTVYQDGHVVTRSGQTYYPGDHGRTLSCQNQRCTIVGTNGRYNGRNVGFQHHHH